MVNLSDFHKKIIKAGGMVEIPFIPFSERFISFFSLRHLDNQLLWSQLNDIRELKLTESSVDQLKFFSQASKKKLKEIVPEIEAYREANSNFFKGDFTQENVDQFVKLNRSIMVRIKCVLDAQFDINLPLVVSNLALDVPNIYNNINDMGIILK